MYTRNKSEKYTRSSCRTSLGARSLSLYTWYSTRLESCCRLLKSYNNRSNSSPHEHIHSATHSDKLACSSALLYFLTGSYEIPHAAAFNCTERAVCSERKYQWHATKVSLALSSIVSERARERKAGVAEIF